MLPQIKEMFDIAVENAIGAANLVIVWAELVWGPEFKLEYIEKAPGRVVVRYSRCALWEGYKECEADPAFIPCHIAHQAICEEGLKAVNPKLTHKLTKSIGRGDPYCEEIFEFKEDKS
ncbi:MAG: L-2-amino-thiazoline-4-carboxylic acid hydrolase [Promethearchaeota archaeon]